MSTNENNLSFSVIKENINPLNLLNSDSLVSKIMFIIFTLFLFIIFFKIGVFIIGLINKGISSPLLINGMIDAKQTMVIPQDPAKNNSITINRSINERKGVEFTWSVWIYINDLQYMQGKYRNVFFKGNNDPIKNGLNYPNNGPGLYIGPHTNELIIMMSTYDTINKEIKISDVPLNKWVNVIIRCKDKTLDVYVNGVITRSIQLTSLPKQNYGDVYAGANGGFDGFISNLRYYDYAIGIADIKKQLYIGPNTRMISSTGGVNLFNPNYLSLSWYMKDY